MKAIVAMSNNRVIGKDGRIPWKCKEDLRFFKKMTQGQVLVMGMKTYESLPTKYLYDRNLVVLTKSKPPTAREFPEHKSAVFFRSFEGAPEQLCNNGKEVWVVGGASIFEQFLPVCTDLYVTIILDDYDGDTYMPDFEHILPEQRVVVEKKNLWIVHYWQKRGLYEDIEREGFDACIKQTTTILGCPYDTECPYSHDRENKAWRLWHDGYVKAYHKHLWKI